MDELQFLKFFYKLLFFLTIIYEISSAEVPRPRGVSLSRASLYDPEKNFVCFDGSLTLPFTQVNDDYCDCSDASDEPGTSACPNGIFHCTNAGHKPLNIASSRVNDGICDCCDGSDEYAKRNVNCVNNCLELGRNAREAAVKRAELVKAGKQLRAELSQKGIQLKQEKKEKLSELQKNKDEAEKVKNEKEILKREIEELESVALEHYRQIEEEEKRKKEEAEAAKNRAEAIETFNKFDSNQNNLIEINELQTRQSFDKDRNGEVSEEEAKYFLNGEESVDREKFIADAWPNIKPYLMMDSGMFKPPVNEYDSHEDEENDNEQPGEGEGDDEEGEDDVEHDEEEEIEQEKKVDDLAAPVYDEETQKLVEKATAARNEFNQADRELQDIISEIKNVEEYLEKDFGPEEEFATLEGQCFDFHDHEYIYKLCPFDKTIQQPKSSSMETRLGVWSRWDGGEENKYDIMLYERGQSCWNGPQRATKIRVACGNENKVTSVSEPNRCEYLFDFTTPAACRELPVDNTEDIHDEL